VRNDFTVSFRNHWYQILPTRGIPAARDTVVIEERLAGMLAMRKGMRTQLQRAAGAFALKAALQNEISWALAELPEKAAAIPWRPASDHPGGN